MTGVPCVTCSKKEDEKEKGEKWSKEPKLGTKVCIVSVLQVMDVH